MKKKILFALEVLGGGGIERVVSNLIPELSNEYSVHVVSIVDAKPVLIPRDIPFTYLGSDKRNKIFRLYERGMKLFSFFKREKFDIIICMGLNVNSLSLFYKLFHKRMKVIVSERNDPNRIKNKLISSIRNYLYKKADLLICQTTDSKEYYTRHGVENIAVIPNPVNDSLPFWQSDSAEPTIVNFCRLEPQKNLFLLINAFEKFQFAHPEYTLKIFGEGSQKEILLNYIQEKKLDKKISIFPFRKDIHDIVKKCKMFVSSSDYEGMSNSMLEALAIGIPSIVTDCPIGGAKDIIQNKVNGLLIPCRNEHQMAEAMVLIAEDEMFSLNLHNNAISIREKLNLNKIISLWKHAIIKVGI